LLVGVGIVEASDGSGLAAEQPVQLGTDGAFRTLANLMAGAALGEHLLADGAVLGRCLRRGQHNASRCD